MVWKLPHSRNARSLWALSLVLWSLASFPALANNQTLSYSGASPMPMVSQSMALSISVLNFGPVPLAAPNLDRLLTSSASRWLKGSFSSISR